MTMVEELAAEVVDITFEYLPLVGTLLGVPNSRDAQLTDHSPAMEAHITKRFDDVLARAAAIDPATLSDTDRVTRLVVLSAPDEVLSLFRSRQAEFTISDSMSGRANEMLQLMPMLSIRTAEQAEAYLSRLAAIPTVLEQLADRHRSAVAAGITPVRPLVEDAVAFLNRYLENDGDPLRRPTPSDESGVDLDGFNHRRDELIRDVVRPAYAKYRDVLLSEMVAQGRDETRAGLCWLPDGDRIYAELLRYHTTTDRDAEDLHQTGLDLIAKLDKEYATIGERVFGTSDVPEIFRRMRTDESLRWGSAEELIAAAAAAVERAEAAAPAWFGRLPSQGCQVQAVPEDEAPGAPPAYYLPPAMDGSRAGIYFANTYQPQERHRHVSEAVAFHEAVPGHHFQVTIAQELEGLPLLRRLASPTAYGEGWGLYCERLAHEMGLYSDDVALLGMLAADSLRAARLVVDTGLHAKGWSREQAVQFMLDRTPTAPVDVDSEVDRYIAQPGQATAYMVGRLEIQRMRAEAEAALGDRFDIRAFHDTVLGQGGLALGVLDDVVRAWVAGVCE
jgi:uncharacterized protein (DUF885 family)